jgi:hypothetical protein
MDGGSHPIGGTKLPAVRKGEEKNEYISRAISYLMKNERLSQDHAIAKAYGMWRQHLKNKGKRNKQRRKK